MKRVLSFFAVFAVLVGVCGCSVRDETETVRGEITSESSSQAESDASSVTTTTSSQDESDASSVTTTTSSQDESEFSLGSTANNTYINRFLGIRCTLPADWVFYTDEEILQLNNIVGDVVDDTVAEQLKNADIIYDMYASSLSDGSSININLEKMSPVQAITVSIKQSLEAQTEAIKTAYENMGYTDIKVNYQKTTVDGKEFDSLNITAKIQGVDFYARCFAFKKGVYIANVSVCSIETDKIQTILSYFTVE